MELSYFAIIIGAIFVNNVVLAQFLGICPFLGVSSKVETSMGMGAAVTFVMAIAAVVAWLIQAYVLVPLDIVYMQTIVFILVIAALVQMVEIMLKKLSPSLYPTRWLRRWDSPWRWCFSPVSARGSNSRTCPRLSGACLSR